jgi:N-formylglutamate deformylase
MTLNAAAIAPKGAQMDDWASDPAMYALAAEPIQIFVPEPQSAPFIFASPHSGRFYPPSFARATRLDPVTLRKSEDAFVDELFSGVTRLGVPLIAARFPRAFVDVNRAPSELDPAMFDAPVDSRVGPRTPRVAAGLGVIPRVVRDGVEIYGARLPAREAAFRLERFYRPYHTALAKLVADARAQFGVAIVVDCHSMPPPAKGHDIVLGDCYGEAASHTLIAQIQKLLGELGFSVARNAPYAGGYTTHLYARRTQGVHALQIEVSRALYLDEERIVKAAGFARVNILASQRTPDGDFPNVPGHVSNPEIPRTLDASIAEARSMPHSLLSMRFVMARAWPGPSASRRGCLALVWPGPSD